jgi:hypothetical protein
MTVSDSDTRLPSGLGIDPENNIAPDVLRILIKGFADEMEIVKQQIVLLGAKVYLPGWVVDPRCLTSWRTVCLCEDGSC